LGSTLAVLGIAWSRTSFGITLLWLTHGRLQRFVVAVFIAMNVARVFVIVWVKCDPVEKIWRRMVPGTCWNLRVSNGYAFFKGVFPGLRGLFFALLPWHLLWGLRMRKKEKLGVAVAMSMCCNPKREADFRTGKRLETALYTTPRNTPPQTTQPKRCGLDNYG
jgi:hypothetical protein